MDETANPYQSPTPESVGRKVSVSNSDESTRPGTWRVFLKWLIVCGISAAPSFIMGLSIGGGRLSEISGMIAGVLLFVVAYTFVECQPLVQRILKRRFVRGTAITGYLTRIIISIIFPIGLFLDIWFGFASVLIAESLFGTGVVGPISRYDADATAAYSFLIRSGGYMFTTVVQGILLNLLLFGYMLMIYGMCCLFTSINVKGDR